MGETIMRRLEQQKKYCDECNGKLVYDRDELICEKCGLIHDGDFQYISNGDPDNQQNEPVRRSRDGRNIWERTDGDFLNDYYSGIRDKTNPRCGKKWEENWLDACIATFKPFSLLDAAISATDYARINGIDPRTAKKRLVLDDTDFVPITDRRYITRKTENLLKNNSYTWFNCISDNPFMLNALIILSKAEYNGDLMSEWINQTNKHTIEILQSYDLLGSIPYQFNRRLYFIKQKYVL